jgi:hypothetical protein
MERGQSDTDRLLLFCLRAGPEGSKASALAMWTESEWHELIRQSARHGLSAYLYHRLQALGAERSIPPPIRERLREITLQNASQNIRLYHHLGKILKILGNDGIPVILLKGAHLAEAVYGSIALRRMGDVDILVRKEDLHRTVRHLVETGFHVTDEALAAYLERIEETRFHVLPERKHFFDLVHPDWKLKLDVHVSLAEEDSTFAVEPDGLWDRAVRPDKAGLQALALSPADSILYQCIHASFHHRFEHGLRPLCDIAETLRESGAGLDWEDLRLISRRWKADRCAWLTLGFARELLGAPVPESALKALKPQKVDPGMIAWARAQIFTPQTDDGLLTGNLIRLWKARRLRDKAAAIRKALFPSRQAMAVHYPAPPGSFRLYFYYFVRLKDLLLRWGRTGSKLLFRDPEMRTVLEGENRKVALKQWLISRS